MEEKLYSPDQVAELLGLHVKTVRGYVRDGRLKAVRIGKQYRIAHSDLEALTGRPVPVATRETSRRRHVDVTCVVEVDAAPPEVVERVNALLLGITANRGQGDAPLRVELAYDEERARLKVVILGNPADTALVLRHVEAVTGS